jgi:hypothetical protein
LMFIEIPKPTRGKATRLHNYVGSSTRVGVVVR